MTRRSDFIHLLLTLLVSSTKLLYIEPGDRLRLFILSWYLTLGVELGLTPNLVTKSPMPYQPGHPTADIGDVTMTAAGETTAGSELL